MSISIQNVSFSYEEKAILSDFSLDCNDGNCIAICGSNGSGKSTLLKLAVGILQPSSGEIYLNGKNLWQKRTFRKPRVIDGHASLIGYVMQKPERQLFAETVYDDVAFGPRNLGKSDDEVKELVNKWLMFFNIENLDQKSPYAISGGQKRMAALAGVLAMDTPNICFDEPSASLDDDGKLLIQQLICELKSSGKSVLLVSHSSEEVDACADKVVTLGLSEDNII